MNRCGPHVILSYRQNSIKSADSIKSTKFTKYRNPINFDKVRKYRQICKPTSKLSNDFFHILSVFIRFSFSLVSKFKLKARKSWNILIIADIEQFIFFFLGFRTRFRIFGWILAEKSIETGEYFEKVHHQRVLVVQVRTGHHGSGIVTSCAVTILDISAK